MQMKTITFRFGGVVAIKDISFDIRERVIRATRSEALPCLSSNSHMFSGLGARSKEPGQVSHDW